MTNIGENRGLFITFEGGEACGKSTQAKLLGARLGAVMTREPGGTALGSMVRQLCLGDEYDPAPVTELLLMAADRAEHVARVIRPALESGRHVICDRYTHSTVAYQSGGRGLDPELVAAANRLATQGVIPDLVIMLDVDEEVMRARLAARGTLNRMERVDDEFTRRVLDSYARQAREDERIVVVDGNGDIAAVEAAIYDAVTGRLGTDRLGTLLVDGK